MAIASRRRARALYTGPYISHCWVHCPLSMGINPAVPVTLLRCSVIFDRLLNKKELKTK